MTIDITSQIGAIGRELRHLERDGRPMRAVVARRTYDSAVDDVWDAITNAERLPRWFLPISGELRLGGRYQLQGNAGGTITTCEPPHHLAVTWEMRGETSWVDVRLSESAPGKTELVLEHVAEVPEEFWKLYGPGAVGVGWDLSLVGLDQHFSPHGIDVRDASQWTASAEGKQFMRGSSEAWGRAAIAGGMEREAATGATLRTTAAYTREPETAVNL